MVAQGGTHTPSIGLASVSESTAHIQGTHLSRACY